jgi:hypothetical protein
VSPEETNNGVFGRTLSANGRATGTEFQANTYTTEEQDDPRAVAIGESRYALVWESTGQDGSGGGIFARLYTADTCGDATEDAELTAADALTVLRAAVASGACKKCVCDTDANGTITTTDALITLQAAVGSPGALSCDSC